jgi:hypothetical protein
VTENELKQAVLKVAYQNGWAVYHVPQRTIHNGGGRGYPDLTCARDGEVLWIELKQEGKTLEKEQADWFLALPAAHKITPHDLETGRVHELLS